VPGKTTHGKTTHRKSAARTDRRRAALQRRRQQATARTASARKAVRRQRRRKILAGFAVVAVAAAATAGFVEWQRVNDHPPSPDLHAALATTTEPLAMTAVPGTYHAVYRAESYTGGKVTRSTEDVSVQRPFNGRVTIREGTDASGALQFEGRSILGSYANYSASGPGQVSGDAPTVAFGDVRLNASLDDLLAKGLFVRKERRQALGRDCQVYRTGTSLQSLKVTAPTATDYADACLDDGGLVLEEVTVVGGKLTQRLTATELVDDATFESNTFTVDGDPVSFDQGGSVLTPVDLATPPPAGFWQLEAPPDGFVHQARYVLQTPDQAGSAAGAPPVSSYVDLWVRGTDLVTVRQGPIGGEPDMSSSASSGDPVDGGPLGTAQLLLSAIGPTVTAHPNADTFVHVSGTLSPGALQTVTAALHQV
jgi:hypothetical protein